MLRFRRSQLPSRTVDGRVMNRIQTAITALIAQMKGAGLTVGAYTVNDAVKAATYRDSGVTLLYSDFLTTKDW